MKNNESIHKTQDGTNEKANDVTLIENPHSYFSKVVENMNNKDFTKLNKYNQNEILMEFNEVNEQIIHQSLLLADYSEEYHNENQNWIEFLDDEKLYFAIKGLKSSDRILLNLWAILKYTQKDIAEIMQQKEKTINKRLVRIRHKLKLRLEGK